MTSWQCVRLIAGIFILLSLASGDSRQPRVYQPMVFGLYGLRWCQPAAKCPDQMVSARKHSAQNWRSARVLNP